MTTSRNEFTGAKLQTKPANNTYRAGWDVIFGKKNAEPVVDSEVSEAEHAVETDK